MANLEGLPQNEFTGVEEKTENPRRIVITGGTEGIGRAIAAEYLSQKTDVAICARTKDNLEDVQDQEKGVRAYQVDLSDRHEAKKFLEAAVSDLKGLDMLILNAGISGVPHQDETEVESVERKEQVFKVNEVAQVALMRAAIEELRKNRGTVVFMTSGLAHKLVPGSEDYGKSKKRIEEYLEDFMNRPGNEDVFYFSVNPGPVDTKMHEEIIQYGPNNLASMSKMAKEKGMLSDPEIIGRIISQLSIGGNKFNAETGSYDIPIQRGEIVSISKENIEFEQNKEKS